MYVCVYTDGIIFLKKDYVILVLNFDFSCKIITTFTFLPTMQEHVYFSAFKFKMYTIGRKTYGQIFSALLSLFLKVN